jgi:hypothetical protein
MTTNLLSKMLSTLLLLPALISGYTYITDLTFSSAATGATTGYQPIYFNINGDDGDPGYRFTSSTCQTISVTDGFCYGDTFNLRINGTVVASSSRPSSVTCPTIVVEGSAAWSNTNFAKASFTVGAGSHIYDIVSTGSPYGIGNAFTRVTTVACPLTCSATTEGRQLCQGKSFYWQCMGGLTFLQAAPTGQDCCAGASGSNRVRFVTSGTAC